MEVPVWGVVVSAAVTLASPLIGWYKAGGRSTLLSKERAENRDDAMEAMKEYRQVIGENAQLQIEIGKLGAKVELLQGTVDRQSEQIKFLLDNERTMRQRVIDSEAVGTENVTLKAALFERAERIHYLEIESAAALRAQEKAEGAVVAMTRMIQELKPNFEVKDLWEEVARNRERIERIEHIDQDN